MCSSLELTSRLRAMHQYHLPAVSASYPPHRDDEPLMSNENTLMFEQPDEEESGAEGELVPYAHRDIKPGNIMLSDDDSPILMDFGSTIKYVAEVALLTVAEPVSRLTTGNRRFLSRWVEAPTHN